MRRRSGAALLGAALAYAALPGVAFADIKDAASAGKLPDSVTCWTDDPASWSPR